MKKFGTVREKLSKNTKKAIDKALLFFDKVFEVIYKIFGAIKSILYILIPFFIIILVIFYDNVGGYKVSYESLTLLMVLLAYFRYFDDK